MEVKIKLFNKEEKIYKNIWEIQNSHDVIIIKKHSHECERFNKEDIEYILIESGIVNKLSHKSGKF